MTTNEYIKKLNAKLAEIVKENKPLLIAVKSVTALQVRRIWINGLNANNNVIGEYSNRDVYINPEKSPVETIKTKGKNGKSKFKNGQNHKTAYFVNYLTYKKAIGKNKLVQSVDLNLYGETQKDWANSEVLSGATATKVNSNVYQIGLRQHNWNKVSKYGNVFGLSKEEKKAFYDVVNSELLKALKK